MVRPCRRRRFGGTASADPRRSSRPPGRCARPGEHVVAPAVASMYDASRFLEPDPQGIHRPVGLVRGEPGEPHLRVARVRSCSAPTRVWVASSASSPMPTARHRSRSAVHDSGDRAPGRVLNAVLVSGRGRRGACGVGVRVATGLARAAAPAARYPVMVYGRPVTCSELFGQRGEFGFTVRLQPVGDRPALHSSIPGPGPVRRVDRFVASAQF